MGEMRVGISLRKVAWKALWVALYNPSEMLTFRGDDYPVF
jgi:hypothetical protein